MELSDNELDKKLKQLKKKDNELRETAKKIDIQTEKDKYRIQGPMGRGLKIKKSGIHMAFAAGTGIIVFIDLIGYLIRMNLNMIPADK